MAWTRGLVLLALVFVAVNAAGDTFCGKKTKKTVTIEEGDKVVFKTQRKRATKYMRNTRCIATYKLGSTCSEMKLSCSVSRISNKDKKQCDKGDKVVVIGEKKSEKFCGTRKPRKTVKRGVMKIMFFSDMKNNAPGSTCFVKCSATTTAPTPPEVPLDGGWSLWSSWSSCKGKTKQRVRTCTSPSPVHGGEECTGEDAEEDCCEAGWSIFNLRCYKLLRGNTSHAEYKSACEESGGQLASVHSEEENDFITSLLRSGPAASLTWIGGQEGSCGTTPEAPCVWLDNTEWTWSNWERFQPNEEDTCLVLGLNNPMAEWYDNTCSHSNGDAVCKI